MEAFRSGEDKKAQVLDKEDLKILSIISGK